MKRVFGLLIIIAVIAGGYMVLQAKSNPCNRVLAYSIGTVDPRFNFGAEELRTIVEDMEKVWEDPLSTEFFRYDPNAKFKINLVFDDRQQKTIDERNSRQQIDLSEESYEKLVEQYNNLSYQHRSELEEFNQKKASYDARLKAYNDEVAYWNKQGGASSADYKRLSDEKKALNALAAELEQLRVDANSDVANLNALAERINGVARDLNKDVSAYNGKFGEPRQFDQGTFTGSAINIFQFNEESDLRLVIAHELGHALGLDHIDDPKAIMYYLMDQQDLSIIELSNGDLKAIKERCGLE